VFELRPEADVRHFYRKQCFPTAQQANFWFQASDHICGVIVETHHVGVCSRTELLATSLFEDARSAGVPEQESEYLQTWITDRKEDALRAPDVTGGGDEKREAAGQQAALEAARRKQKLDEPGMKGRATKPKWLKFVGAIWK
jgi:hypothetical protein